MNLLEHYIKKIHSERILTEDWTKDFDHGFVKVDITVNCYGSLSRVTTVFSDDEWEKIKSVGYYLR